MSRTHDQFLGELRASREAVSLVAAWLVEERGVPVLYRPNYEASVFAERSDYADDGDLEVVLRVEVKHLSRTFTGKADFPFARAIVDAQKNFDKKRPRPYCYVILNQEGTAGLFVDVAATRKHWKVEQLPDSRNGVKQPFYTCEPRLMVDVTL